MANHLRRQIRDAIAARVTGLATTGARVYVNNVDPLGVAELPGLTVRNGGEMIERKTLTAPNPIIGRTMTIWITAVDKAATGVPDSLDQMCQEVEIALLGAIDAMLLGGLAKDTTLIAVDEPKIAGDGDKIVGSVDMQFQVLVLAQEGIPDAAL